jgi:prepilin-type N-terminal cleavage/methylation domain-containing protein
MSTNFDSNHYCSNESGFTLVELMIAISIIMIMGWVVSPALTTMSYSNDLITTERSIRNALNNAKTLARLQQPGTNLIVCPIETSTSRNCIDSVIWQHWMIWADSDDNGVVNNIEVFATYSARPNIRVSISQSPLEFSTQGLLDSSRVITLTVPKSTGDSSVQCLRFTFRSFSIFEDTIQTNC